MSGQIERINQLQIDFQTKLEAAIKEGKEANISNLKAEYLGKNGTVTEFLKSLKDMNEAERKMAGPLINELKNLINEKSQEAIAKLEFAAVNLKLKQERVDISLTENKLFKAHKSGGYHPRTLVQQEIEDIFLSMGFEILDGPHIEDEFHNFEALNIPGDHPARDMQDTFWFQNPHDTNQSPKHLLRTHTSSIQVRGMMSRRPPFRFIAPGIVFRSERTDASHEMVFSQLEGMMVGKDISVGHLIYFMKTILKEIFKKDVEVRLRPGFFPFVEPGFELDIRCLICKGEGCSVCKQVGWVELLPCGMVHPNVLQAGGIDPKEWNGFAFGLGLDRLVMMRYGIEDIRHLQSGDLRFNSQFKLF